MNDLDAINLVGRLVHAAGGRALLVGGCVRDKLLDLEPKDFDIEVFGLSPEKLEEVLGAAFKLDLVGLSFGVIKLHNFNIDVAIPRRETKLGLGHKGFKMEYDPTLSLTEASARRDFTINAIYSDPLTGEILDPWNGRVDLETRTLRHVSEHFKEDPLRVLRGMQFVARFDLTVSPETIQVCRDMTPEGLPPERLFEEWAKLLTKGVKISKGLNFLREVGWVKYYPELMRLIGCEQAPEWHPEGDVWNHTLCCLDAFAKQPKNEDDLIVGLAVLCHDFGKPSTSFFDKRKGRIRSLGHDDAGVEPTISFLKRLTNEERLLKEVPPLVKEHMRVFSMWKSKSGEAAIRRLAARVIRIDRLLRVAAADDEGRPPFPSEPESIEWLRSEAERLAVLDSAPKPILMGRHLIEKGLKPGVHFGEILAKAYDAQLEGKFKDLEGALKYVGLS
ncbi:MAG: polynucleotide adenylyltransferase [Kiritimatiellae bacterium]|nr:polynucleotide adenylyltransferase [Kiritimatiellia bacterium]